MIKKYRKSICIGIFLIFFLFIGFFYLSINKISAATLEVKYPAISGQSPNTNPTLPNYVIYLFNAGMFIGFSAVFLSLLIAGVMYFLSPIKNSFVSDAKDRISGAISGLLILTLTYLIITTINPQLSILNANSPAPIPPPPAPKQAPGVYFYNQASCSDNPPQISTTTSVPDLGNSLRNRVNAVGVVQDPNDTQTSFITILYANTNFWGKCQFITTSDAASPNQTCQTNPVTWASSASVHKYDFSPSGDGVYFYRKSYFNEKGGYLKLSGADIGKGYFENLDQLEFTGDSSSGDCNVPEDEQDCTSYNKNGDCIETTCPTLGGENISSVKISPPGSYLVLFVYLAPGDDITNGPWTSCQEFPTIDDINKLGPEQMKWQGIRNSNGLVPNHVFIIPTKD